MEMLPPNCWDCPTTFLHAALAFVLGLGALYLSTTLRRIRADGIRVVAVVLQAIAIGWLVFLAANAFRHGVAWRSSLMPDAVPTSLFTLMPLALIGAFAMRRWQARRT